MQNEAMHITFHARTSAQNQRFKQAEGRRALITFRFDLFFFNFRQNWTRSRFRNYEENLRAFSAKRISKIDLQTWVPKRFHTDKLIDYLW